MRLPLGRRAFAATTLFKFHFFLIPLPQLARLIRGLFAFLAECDRSAHFNDDRTPLHRCPATVSSKHKCSYYRFHSHLRNVS